MSFVNKLFNRPIFQFLLVSMLIISITPVVILGLTIFVEQTNSTTSQNQTAAKEHALEWSTSVDQILKNGILETTLVGQSPSVMKSISVGSTWNETSLWASYEGGFFGAPNPADNLPNKTSLAWNPANDPNPDGSNWLQQSVGLNPHFLEFFVTDMRGYLVATMKSTPSDFDQYGETWFMDTLKNGLYTTYEYDASSAHTVYTISVLLKYSNGTDAGVIKAALNLQNMLTDFNNFNFYGTGFGILVAKATGSIISAKSSTYLNNNFTSFTSPSLINSFPAILASSSDNSSSVRTSFNHQDYFMGVSTTSDSPFYTVILIPTSNYNDAINLLIASIATILIIFIPTVIALSILNARTISKPLSKLNKISEYASNGDLTHGDNLEMIDNARNEIYRLSNNFKNMVTSIKGIITNVATTASSMASSSQEMASSSEEVNASSEEISSIAQQMAKGSQDQTSQINETVHISKILKDNFEQKIADINQTSMLIENISSQVNMLALNASIEAARAGEYGRGFAVVADNIRRLADDAKDSVSKVQATVESLKTSLSKSIDEIQSSIERVSSVAEETASGSEEASAATEEQAATMQELSASAQELSNLASQLEELVKKFKI